MSQATEQNSRRETGAEPSPAHFIDIATSFQKSAAIRAAVELELFTVIASGVVRSPEIAAAVGADQPGIAVLCDYLAFLGFLVKEGDSYQPTEDSRIFLDRRSPAYFGSVVDFLISPEMIDMVLGDPAGYVRNGGSVGLANVAPDNPIWVKFAEGMAPLAGLAAERLAALVAAGPRPKKVLDISAGPGGFGIAVAKAVPEAEIVGVDWEIVLAVARRHAEEAGLGGRYRTVAGSAFDVDWGDGYDLVMIPGFLHHFDIETSSKLMRRVRESLAPGGRAVATEFVVAEDRLSPPWPASFSYLMLATTPKGQAFSASECVAIARGAGFAGARVEPLAPPHGVIWFE